MRIWPGAAGKFGTSALSVGEGDMNPWRQRCPALEINRPFEQKQDHGLDFLNVHCSRGALAAAMG